MSKIYFNKGLLRIQHSLSEEELEALLQDLIGWRRQKEELVASPLLLPYRQAHELVPDLEEDEDSILGEFAQLQARLREPARDLADAEHLFHVQKRPTKLLTRRSRALVTSAPGTGKTVVALTALAQHRKATKPSIVVIVCPLSLIDGWRAEAEAWWLGELRARGESPQVYVWRKTQETSNLPTNLGADSKSMLQVVITTPETIYGLYKRNMVWTVFGDRANENSWLILDESFLYKNRASKRSHAARELAELFRNVWELSGMPISRFNDDLFFQLRLLYPTVFTSYWKFAKRYCIIRTTPWGDKIVGDRKGSLELLKEDLADILIEGDFPEEVPDWQPEIVKCPLSGPQLSTYKILRDELLLKVGEMGEEDWAKEIPILNLISLTTFLNKAASNLALLGDKDCSAKEDRLIELIQERPLPALIWINYRETAERLLHKLGPLPGLKVAVLTGGTKPADRKPIVDAFQKGELNCLILNPAVGKYGFTLTAARTAYYLEKTFDGEAFYQSLFRARRIVSNHPVNLIFLLATLPLEGKDRKVKKSIDELIHEKVIYRSEKAQRLTVGDLLGTL